MLQNDSSDFLEIKLSWWKVFVVCLTYPSCLGPFILLMVFYKITGDWGDLSWWAIWFSISLAIGLGIGTFVIILNQGKPHPWTKDDWITKHGERE